MMEKDAATLRVGQLVCLIAPYITEVQLLHIQTKDHMEIPSSASSLVSYITLAITVAMFLIHPTLLLLPVLPPMSPLFVSIMILRMTMALALAQVGTIKIHLHADFMIMKTSQQQFNVVIVEVELSLVKLPIKKQPVSMTILLVIVLETLAPCFMMLILVPVGIMIH
jgi:hypothetical protein